MAGVESMMLGAAVALGILGLLRWMSKARTPQYQLKTVNASPSARIFTLFGQDGSSYQLVVDVEQGCFTYGTTFESGEKDLSFAFSDILRCELLVNSAVLSDCNTARSLARAVAGGMIFEEAGSVTGMSLPAADMVVANAGVRLVLRSEEHPVLFIDAGTSLEDARHIRLALREACSAL